MYDEKYTLKKKLQTKVCQKFQSINMNKNSMTIQNVIGNYDIALETYMRTPLRTLAN
jgi:hypothetical protein